LNIDVNIKWSLCEFKKKKLLLLWHWRLKYISIQKIKISK